MFSLLSSAQGEFNGWTMINDAKSNVDEIVEYGIVRRDVETIGESVTSKYDIDDHDADDILDDSDD